MRDIASVKTYVNTEIANLVDSAPSNLDTLKELADFVSDLSGSTVSQLMLDKSSLHTRISTEEEDRTTSRY